MSTTHPLSQKWYYWTVKIGQKYNEIKVEIPIQDVETFWEITNEFPEFQKITGAAIGLFKDPMPPHYEDNPTTEFTFRYERDEQFFLKILCAAIGGQFDEKVKEYGTFNGIYIGLNKSGTVKYCFWFKPITEEENIHAIAHIMEELFGETITINHYPNKK